MNWFSGTAAELANRGFIAVYPAKGWWRTRPAQERYDLPARTDCRACHEGNVSRVLGFSALQLSAARDPGAPHAEPLRPTP